MTNYATPAAPRPAAYRPDDRSMLGEPPWKPTDPALIAWEQAHGHDVRLDCDHRDCCPVLREAEAAAPAAPGLDVDAARKAVEYAFEAAKEWQPDPVHSSMNNPIWPFDKFTDAFAAEYARLTAAAEASGE